MPARCSIEAETSGAAKDVHAEKDGSNEMDLPQPTDGIGRAFFMILTMSRELEQIFEYHRDRYRTDTSGYGSEDRTFRRTGGIGIADDFAARFTGTGVNKYCSRFDHFRFYESRIPCPEDNDVGITQGVK